MGEGDFETLRAVLNRTRGKRRSPSGRRKTNDATLIGSVPSGNRNVARIRHDRALEIALGLRDSHGKKRKGAAYVLLRLSLTERSNNKRCPSDTADRQEPLETWRRHVLHHIELGLGLLAGPSKEEG